MLHDCSKGLPRGAKFARIPINAMCVGLAGDCPGKALSSGNEVFKIRILFRRIGFIVERRVAEDTSSKVSPIPCFPARRSTMEPILIPRMELL